MELVTDLVLLDGELYNFYFEKVIGNNKDVDWTGASLVIRTPVRRLKTLRNIDSKLHEGRDFEHVEFTVIPNI